MNHKIPENTKLFLVNLLENKIFNNPNDCVFANKTNYCSKYFAEALSDKLKIGVMQEPKPEKPKQDPNKKIRSDIEKMGVGGFGTGMPKDKKFKSSHVEGDVSNILMGDTDEAGRLGALGAYGVGTVATGLGTFADWLSGIGLPVSKEKVQKFSALPGVGSALKQIGDISGKTWFDTQASKIGRGQMELAAQGAGSPWVKFRIPE